MQRWFRAADFDQNCAAGRVALDRELGRLGIGEAKFEKLAAALGYRKVDDFLAAIGSGDLKVSQAVAPLREALEPRRSEDDLGRPAPPRLRDKIAGGLRILGVGNLLTRMASCCSPLPGDAIVGYITQGRGVSIHRRDCGNILRLGDGAARRLVEVEWGTDDEAGYPVDIEVTAHDRRGLLHDITAVFSDARVNIAAVDMQTARAQNVARVSLTAEVSDIDELSGLLSRIARIPNVTDVRRVTH